MRAVNYIKDMSRAVDRLFENFGSEIMLQELSYDKEGYGILQRVELKSITEKIRKLKTQVDELAIECEDISKDDLSEAV